MSGDIEGFSVVKEKMDQQHGNIISAICCMGEINTRKSDPTDWKHFLKVQEFLFGRRVGDQERNEGGTKKNTYATSRQDVSSVEPLFYFTL